MNAEGVPFEALKERSRVIVLLMELPEKQREVTNENR
jgi:hypothetical protein